MAVEKIDLSLINEMKEQLDIEAKLPKINRMIDELAEPYMAEVESLLESDDIKYVIDENGDILYDDFDEANAKIAQLDSLIQEISSLVDVESYIKEQLAKGLSVEQATAQFEKDIAALEEKMKKILNLNEEENIGSV